MGRNNQVKYKKSPQAPRRFKSSYMFFSTEKHSLIRQELAEKGGTEKLSTTDVAKLVSQAWKEISDEEREKWEDMARKDKARYEMEKSMYTGPWKVPAKTRSNKDPNSPKRPMSAFLSFSNYKRTLVKEKHPDAGNAEVSRILAQMWKDASAEERKEHVDQEFKLRQKYKLDIAKWRENSETEIETARKEREDEAMKAVLEGRPLGPQEHSNHNHHEPFRNDGRMLLHHQEGRLDPSAEYNDISYHTDQPFYDQSTQAQSYMEEVPPYTTPQHHYQHYHQQHHYHHLPYYNNDQIAPSPYDGGGYPSDHSGCYPPGTPSIDMVNAAAATASTGYMGGAHFDGCITSPQQHYHHYLQHHYPANNAYDYHQPMSPVHLNFQPTPHADKSHEVTMPINSPGNVYESAHVGHVEAHHHSSEDGGPRTPSATFVPPHATYQPPQDPYGNGQNYYHYGSGTYHSANSH